MSVTEHLPPFTPTMAGLEQCAGALRALLEIRAVPGDARYYIELAFDEIASNIIRHGRPTGEIDLTIQFDVGEVVLTFEDNGVAFDPCDRPHPVLPLSPEGSIPLDDVPVGGRGLALLRTFVTQMAYERTPQQRNRLSLAIPVR